jgi:hypothetical protein
MSTYFSDFFRVKRKSLDDHGAFNVSLVTDLPLFIDPFLLFTSEKQEYQRLHASIIEYLIFLRDNAERAANDSGLIDAWYRFPEVKQNWFGFSATGNSGSGLGPSFAVALNENLHKLFQNFGAETVTRGSHLEKLCLIREGVGRDNISDFTTNLIKGFLCEYTEGFAKRYLPASDRRMVCVSKVSFNYQTEAWQNGAFELPWFRNDYVLLTPRDILTKDDTWINKSDLVHDFETLADAVPNEELRAQINNYLNKVLTRDKNKEPTRQARADAARSTILHFPQLIDYYIREKEDSGDQAQQVSAAKVEESEQLFIQQITALQHALEQRTDFYKVGGRTYDEAKERLAHLKDVIENKGGHRIFYVDNEPIQREADLHIMYRLVWFGTPSDVSREVNDGRGPADFKISRGSGDKTIVEFKLAKNPQLRRNLERQAEIYKKASDAKGSLKCILYFSREEHARVLRVLKELGLFGHPDVFLIDARKDNKPSGSKA